MNKPLPNHIHGVIQIVGVGPRAYPESRACLNVNGQPQTQTATTERATTGGCPYGIIMNKSLPNRQSIRLKNYDYAQPGYYFVTICIQNREHLLGEIIDGNMQLNPAGNMIQTIWNEIPQFYNGIQIDDFIVMPNHIHGVIQIVGAGPRACPESRACPEPRSYPESIACPNVNGPPQNGQPQGVAPAVLSLPDVVHRFKTMTTKKYTDGVKQHDWFPFPGKLWQRNYWEHIVRNDDELNRIRNYIQQNPQAWQTDKLNGGSGNRVMESPAMYGEQIWMV